MTNLFLGFLNRSLSAAFLIFAVVLVRLAFKKAAEIGACAPVGAGGGAAFVPVLD